MQTTKGHVPNMPKKHWSAPSQKHTLIPCASRSRPRYGVMVNLRCFRPQLNLIHSVADDPGACPKYAQKNLVGTIPKNTRRFQASPNTVPFLWCIEWALATWNYGRTVGGFGFFYYRNLLARQAQRCPNISGSPKNDPTASPNTVPFFRRIEWALANWNYGRTIGRFGVFYYRNLLARHKQQCPHIPGSPNNDPMASPLPLAHWVGSGHLKRRQNRWRIWFLLIPEVTG